MCQPDDLLSLCEGIRIARLNDGLGHTGHLKDEIKLFSTLIRLYRSPQMLLRITKAKLEDQL